MFVRSNLILVLNIQSNWSYSLSCRSRSIMPLQKDFCNAANPTYSLLCYRSKFFKMIPIFTCLFLLDITGRNQIYWNLFMYIFEVFNYFITLTFKFSDTIARDANIFLSENNFCKLCISSVEKWTYLPIQNIFVDTCKR